MDGGYSHATVNTYADEPGDLYMKRRTGKYIVSRKFMNRTIDK